MTFGEFIVDAWFKAEQEVNDCLGMFDQVKSFNSKSIRGC